MRPPSQASAYTFNIFPEIELDLTLAWRADIKQLSQYHREAESIHVSMNLIKDGGGESNSHFQRLSFANLRKACPCTSSNSGIYLCILGQQTLVTYHLFATVHSGLPGSKENPAMYIRAVHYPCLMPERDGVS